MHNILKNCYKISFFAHIIQELLLKKAKRHNIIKIQKMEGKGLMKKDSGMGIIQLMILIIIIIMLVAGSIYFARLKYNEAKIETIKTNMLLIEWKVKDFIDIATVNKSEDKTVGIKIADMQENEIIQEFLNKGIISNEEYEKYYVLTDEYLEKLKSEITNEEGSYYLVNIENYEMIITQGVEFKKDKTLYKLSDIENEQAKNNKQTENNEKVENNKTEEAKIEEKETDEATE